MKKNNWKKYEEDLMEPISDKLTDVVEYLVPDRKQRSRGPAQEKQDDGYFEELKRRKRARYEALKNKAEE
jgi:hypothetical protein